MWCLQYNGVKTVVEIVALEKYISSYTIAAINVLFSKCHWTYRLSTTNKHPQSQLVISKTVYNSNTVSDGIYNSDDLCNNRAQIVAAVQHWISVIIALLEQEPRRIDGHVF